MLKPKSHKTPSLAGSIFSVVTYSGFETKMSTFKAQFTDFVQALTGPEICLIAILNMPGQMKNLQRLAA